MPYKTIHGKRVFFHTPSPEHPSGHGATSPEQNNAFVAGVKMAQAHERFLKNGNRKTANSYNKAKDKHDRLQKKYHDKLSKGLIS